MAEKWAGFVITLKDDIAGDDRIATLNAIGHIKGVVAIAEVVTTAELHIAQARAAREFEKKLLDTFFPE